MYTLPWNFALFQSELISPKDMMIGATQVEGGLSIGSANQKYLFGLSHILSKALIAGYTF